MSHRENILSSSATMTSVQALREFINERLIVAAGEIFTVFEQTIVRYEEEIDRQRRLLENSCIPQIKFYRTELPQLHDCREEQLFKQETTYCLGQGEPEPPQIKEEQEQPGLQRFKEDQEEPEPPQIEHEELGPTQEGEQLKFECDTFILPSTEGQSDLSEPKEVLDTEQFLSCDSEVHDVKRHIDSESTINAELKSVSVFHSDCVVNVPVSEKQAERETLLCEETCGKTCGTLIHQKKIICEICGRGFTRQDNLLVHMRTHTGEKPYSCETCGKSFSVQSGFRNHVRTHTGEKPYSCEVCGKSFTSPSGFRTHMRTHTGEKPYSCKTCGKSFSKLSNLLRHMRIHTGEKPYSCQTCGKSFSLHSTLLGHIRTHTGEKPYSCQTCGKCFRQHGTLFVHMRTHIIEKPS